MKRILIQFLIAVIVTAKCVGQTAEKSFSSEQLREELKMMKTTLEEAHPGLDVFDRRGDLRESYAEIDAKLSAKKEWTNIEFYRMANLMIKELQDGHMKFLPEHKHYPFYFNHSSVFPFIVRFDDQNRLLIAAAEDSGFKGKILKSINERSIEEIVSVLNANMYVDGKSQAGSEQTEQYFSAWYADYIDHRGEFSIVLSDGQGKEEKLSIKGIEYEQWKKLDSTTLFLPGKLAMEVDENKLAYLRVPSFMTPKRQFKKFLKANFKEIKRAGAEQLIVDIRGNEGGNDREGMDLYRYLALKKFRYYEDITLAFRKVDDLSYRQHIWFPFPKILNVFIKKNDFGKYEWTKHKNFGVHRPAKNAFTGKLGILQDGLSFSASTEFLSRVQADNRATLVGTETAGAYKHDFSGTFLFLNLPYTKITMANPVASYRMAVPDTEKRNRGIIPNVQVRRSAEAILQNRDLQLERLRQKIKVEMTTAGLR